MRRHLLYVASKEQIKLAQKHLTISFSKQRVKQYKCINFT